MNLRRPKPFLRGALLGLALAFALPALALGQDQKRNIVFGFFNRELPDGSRHNLVDELRVAKGGLDYFEWQALGKQFPQVGPSWDEKRVLDAMDLMARSGRRIQFNLTGFEWTGPRSPLAVGRTDGIQRAGITSWELAQVRHNLDFWEHTDFFERRSDGSYRKLGAAAVHALGLRYVPPELAALDAKKGARVRRSPSEDVYEVKGEPGKQLVVRHAIGTGDPATDRAEKDRAAERLLEESAVLEQFTAHGVATARIHGLGTLGGELAFIQDATAAPVATKQGEATLVVARGTDGKPRLAGYRTSERRVEVTSELARTTTGVLQHERGGVLGVISRLRDRSRSRDVPATRGMSDLLERRLSENARPVESGAER